MLASNYPDAIIEEPIIEKIIRHERPLPPHPGTAPGCPDTLHRERPANQAAFTNFASTPGALAPGISSEVWDEDARISGRLGPRMCPGNPPAGLRL